MLFDLLILIGILALDIVMVVIYCMITEYTIIRISDIIDHVRRKSNEYIR
jgi:hypothetical protein